MTDKGSTVAKGSTKLIVFDWDGTLSDSVSRIVSCIQLAAADHQMLAPTFDQAKDIIGLGLREAIGQLFPDAEEALVEEFSLSYSAHYRSQDSNPCDFFPNVLDTLQQLRDQDYLLAVATGKSRAGLDRVLGATGLAELFHGSRCADETASKPQPLMLEQLLQEFNLQPQQALMVGDTEFDMEMAVNAAMPRLGVSYGAHHANRLQRYQPIACIDHFAEIINLL
ncbi:HAD-IA family hydrolase [Porticoccaceae bacterium]|jgi:phosphoglycolate phosphatase|nr:HAD-IA family hydrolase [Porticoccaceae bacterium]